MPEKIKRFLEDAKKTAFLPEEETCSLTLELNTEIIRFIHDLAIEWGCTENDIIVATLMAICDEDPENLRGLTT